MDLKGFAVFLSYNVVLLIHVTCFIMVCTACYYVLLLVEIWSAVVYKFVCLEVRIKVISESRENIGKWKAAAWWLFCAF